MAVTFQEFDGQVPNAQGDLVAAVTNTTLLFSMNFHNTDTVVRTLQLWLNDGSTSRKLLQVDVQPDATVSIDTKYTLTSGQSVEGEADAASVIDFWISGAEIT